jgi:hypothetical protein
MEHLITNNCNKNKTKLNRENALLKTADKLMPIILTTQEAEIRRIGVQSNPGQIVRETRS